MERCKNIFGLQLVFSPLQKFAVHRYRFHRLRSARRGLLSFVLGDHARSHVSAVLWSVFLRRPPFLVMLAVAVFSCVAFDFRVQYGETLDFARRGERVGGPQRSCFTYRSKFRAGTSCPMSQTRCLSLGTFLIPLPLILSGVATQTVGGICTFFTLAPCSRRIENRELRASLDVLRGYVFASRSAFLRRKLSLNPITDRSYAIFHLYHRC